MQIIIAGDAESLADGGDSDSPGTGRASESSAGTLIARRRLMVSQERWAPWIYWLFVAATAADYIWQVPYYVHFSAVRGSAPAPLAVLLLMTFAWFAAAAVQVYRRRPRGFGWMAAFLIAEIGFYLVHNAS